MAFTQTQLDALEEAIALGALSVRHGDKTVTYDSIPAMLKLRDRMKREISGRKSTLVHRTTFSRGDGVNPVAGSGRNGW